MPSKFKNPPGSHLQKCRSNPAGFLKMHLYWPLIHMPIWVMVFATGTHVHVSLIGILGGGPLYYRFCSARQQLKMAKEFGWILKRIFSFPFPKYIAELNVLERSQIFSNLPTSENILIQIIAQMYCIFLPAVLHACGCKTKDF